MPAPGGAFCARPSGHASEQPVNGRGADADGSRSYGGAVNDNKVAAIIYIVAIGLPLIALIWACITPTKPSRGRSDHRSVDS